MLRTAMLGVAHVHANGYARQIIEHPEAQIVCVWDDQADRGTAAAARYGVPFADDLEALLSRQDVDGVVVNAPTDQHPEILIAAAAHGKHIFTEKALTIATADADRVVDAVHASGIKFMISLPRRTWPESLFFKQVLDEGWLGRVTMMRARLAHPGALDRWFSGPTAWFGDREQAGGGALFDLGCHIVDLMGWFLGEPASVVAVTQNFSGEYDIDDQTVAIVQFKQGALGILDCTWVHRAGPNPIEIYGTEGYAGYDGRRESIQLISNELQPEGIRGSIHPLELPEALPSPMDQWISAVLHDTPMTIGIEDGRNLTRLMEAIYQAADSGCQVVV
ncbi:MAG: Gfo/Idh/MocA family oxidoreductase [Chloroflexota bacterium]|nr:Gfo/Idh/MocA family oxidoreductase [Chloroflexota bacterium]